MRRGDIRRVKNREVGFKRYGRARLQELQRTVETGIFYFSRLRGEGGWGLKQMAELKYQKSKGLWGLVSAFPDLDDVIPQGNVSESVSE